MKILFKNEHFQSNAGFLTAMFYNPLQDQPVPGYTSLQRS